MTRITLEIQEPSKLPFLLELLQHLDFVSLTEDLEDEGLAIAMKEAKEEGVYLNREEAIKFLSY
ncbi:MAG: hypothetical protein ACPGVB_11225 [Chitinophagales bacterium]